MTPQQATHFLALVRFVTVAILIVMRTLARFAQALLCGRSKHAVHGVGEALCTLVAVQIFGRVYAAEPKSIQTGAVFILVTFVAITFISDPNSAELFHKAA